MRNQNERHAIIAKFWLHVFFDSHFIKCSSIGVCKLFNKMHVYEMNWVMDDDCNDELQALCVQAIER